jgi:hypothetical protein
MVEHLGARGRAAAAGEAVELGRVVSSVSKLITH